MNARDADRRRATALAGIALCALAGFAGADAPQPGSAPGVPQPYERMAPLEQYLMPDPRAEIALARSAAPSGISDHATVLTLGRMGYATAIAGSNGFTCLVERSWMSPLESAEFWNPKMRGPVCYNPAATKSVLLYTLRRTNLVLRGLSKSAMFLAIKDAIARKELPRPLPGAMSYMMSKDGYLGDKPGHWHPHLMFHVPKTSAASWGANVDGSPVLLDERELPEPQTVFLVPLGHWSDGSAAMMH